MAACINIVPQPLLIFIVKKADMTLLNLDAKCVGMAARVYGSKKRAEAKRTPAAH